MIWRKNVIVRLILVFSNQHTNTQAIIAMHLLQDKGLSDHRRFLATVTCTQHESAPTETDQRLGYDNGSACQAERMEVLAQPILAFVSASRVSGLVVKVII